MTLRSTFLGLASAVAVLCLPAAAMAADGFAQSGGTLRAGPSSSYPRVGYVSGGEALTVYGCLSGYSWCDVSDGDDRGWYPGSRIGFLNDGRRVRLPSYAPALGLAIIGFGFNDYWDSHYRSRSWYNEPRYWRRNNLSPPRRDRDRDNDNRPGMNRPDRGPDGPNANRPDRDRDNRPGVNRPDRDRDNRPGVNRPDRDRDNRPGVNRPDRDRDNKPPQASEPQRPRVVQPKPERPRVQQRPDRPARVQPSQPRREIQRSSPRPQREAGPRPGGNNDRGDRGGGKKPNCPPGGKC